MSTHHLAVVAGRARRLVNAGVPALPVTQAELELVLSAVAVPPGVPRPKGPITLGLIAGVEVYVTDDPDAWIALNYPELP